MYPTKAYAALQEKENLQAYMIERRAVGKDDVQIEIDYCGVCHTDLHFVNNDWGWSGFPVVPGHEIIGHVKSIGEDVKKYKIGDRVAVGVIVDSCGNCQSCEKDLQQYCMSGMGPGGVVMTYGSPTEDPGGVTFGGYSKQIICKESFTLKVPENLEPSRAAPLVCAGITTYSPLKTWKVGPGQKVGIIGLGGLGHMGVKFAKALGANVSVITTSKNKINDAKKIGADEVIVSNDSEDLIKYAGQFDFLLDTIPISHSVDSFLGLLKIDGTICLVGSPDPIESVSTLGLWIGRKRISGSAIGGIRETQEMLDFCGKNNVVADVEIIPINKINDAFKRMQSNDIKYRFVIDMSTL